MTGNGIPNTAIPGAAQLLATRPDLRSTTEEPLTLADVLDQTARWSA